MSYLDQFHHVILGQPSAPKLVFLHGLLGFSANWRSVARHFESDFHILIFDQRGHGRSFQPASGYAPSDYADDLLKITDELGWSSIHLVGHSMGGRNALDFAARFPERVEKLVIEDIGPIGHPQAADTYRRMFAAVPVPFASREVARNFMTHQFPKVWPSRGSALGQFLYSNLVEREDGSFNWRVSMAHMVDSVFLGHAQDRWKEWESLRMPTLLIRGELSRDLDQATYEEMLRRLPQAHGAVIAGAGHWVHFEKLDAFVGELKRFLLECE